MCEHELCCLQGVDSGAAAVGVVDWTVMKEFMNSIQSCVIQSGIVSKFFGSKNFPGAFKAKHGDDEFKRLCAKLRLFTYSNALFGASMDIEFHNSARPGWDWAGDRFKVHLERAGDGVKWELFLSVTSMGNERNGWTSEKSGSINSKADLEAFFESWLGRVDGWESLCAMLIDVYFV